MNDIQKNENFNNDNENVINQRKEKRKKALSISGLVFCILGILGFVGCFVWFIVSASKIESTRFDKILPMSIFVGCMVLFVIGIVLLMFSKKGEVASDVINEAEEKDNSFEEKLARNTVVNKNRKLKLGEIAYWAIEDSEEEKNENMTVEQSIVEDKVNELKEKIKAVEERLGGEDATTQEKKTDEIKLNFEEADDNKNKREETVIYDENQNKQFSNVEQTNAEEETKRNIPIDVIEENFADKADILSDQKIEDNGDDK